MASSGDTAAAGIFGIVLVVALIAPVCGICMAIGPTERTSAATAPHSAARLAPVPR